MASRNSLLHAFTFEDLLDDDEDSDLGQENNNQNELDLFSKQTSKRSLKSAKSKDYSYKKKLTKSSKVELTIRIILYSLTVIFIPLSYMVKTSFDDIEINYLFKNMNDLVMNNKLKQRENNIFYFYRVFHDKDFLLGVSIVFYVILHPYIAIKIIFASSIFYFIINFMKCITQSKTFMGNNDL